MTVKRLSGSKVYNKYCLETTMSRIYTHSGQAHADELLACAILIAVKGDSIKEIVRVRSDKDLPTTLPEGDFIIDIGGVHDGESRFDHHQDNDEVEDESAATLVAKRFAPELLRDRLWARFLQRVTYQDNNGLKAVESFYGISSESSSFLLLEWGLTTLFQKEPLEAATLVASMVQDRLDFLEKVAEAEAWLPENSEVVEVNGLKCLVLKTDPKTSGIEQAAVNAATAKIIDREGIHVSMSFDPRSAEGEVRTLFRTNHGAGKVDFTKSAPAEPTFCHKGGFLLNFRPRSEGEWRELVIAAKL